jgi:YebC/PmpR family DNA-binding regulatory protein
MSGHNKWSKIKHKKAATDAARGKIFSKHTKLITMEVRRANGNEMAANVQAAIERAKRDSMPKENIARAVQKGSGANASAIEEVMFEGFGPGGVPLLIHAVTDNNNRTAPEIRHVFTKAGLELGVPGSASWAFTKTDDGYKPISPIEINGPAAETLETFIATLEDHEDVTSVYSGATHDQS